jgi:hypothetical protein
MRLLTPDATVSAATAFNINRIQHCQNGFADSASAVARSMPMSLNIRLSSDAKRRRAAERSCHSPKASNSRIRKSLIISKPVASARRLALEPQVEIPDVTVLRIANLLRRKLREVTVLLLPNLLNLTITL